MVRASSIREVTGQVRTWGRERSREMNQAPLGCKGRIIGSDFRTIPGVGEELAMAGSAM